MKNKSDNFNIKSFEKLIHTIVVFCALSTITLPAQAQIVPDQYEPDNTISNAKPIAFNVPQTRTIHSQGFSERDVDLIAIFLPEAGDVEITIEGGIILGNLSLLDGLRSGFGFGFSGVSCCGNVPTEGQTFRLDQVVRAGLYYINVRGAIDSSLPFDQRISEYTITASLLPGSLSSMDYQNLPGDQYEPDDSIFTAGFAVNGEIQERTFHYSEDVDWLVFRLDGCAEILAETASILSGSQLGMRLWNQKFEVIETAVTKFSYKTVVSESFSSKLRSGIYFISLTQVGSESEMDSPNPHLFRITAFQCEDTYLPPIINFLLGD